MQSSSAESEKLVWYNTLQQKRKGVKNMKILHLSDLHLGRRLYHHSFLPQQEKMLEQVVKIAVEQSVQAVLIAGDVYDKNVPAAEAVTVLDSFLTALSEKKDRSISHQRQPRFRRAAAIRQPAAGTPGRVYRRDVFR